MVNDNRYDSERGFYALCQDQEECISEKRCIFCDELEDYIFYPYTKNGKGQKLYKELLKDMEEAYICMQKHTGEYIHIPCSINDGQKKILIAESVFNLHWKKISQGIVRSLQMRKNTLNITKSSPNKNVNTSLLETDTREAYIGNDCRIAYRGRQQDIEKQRLASRRANILDNPKMRFIYSKSGQLIHDRTCEEITGISDRDFMGAESLPEQAKLCEKCRRKIYIRNAIEKDPKYFSFYDNFLTKSQVGFRKLEYFLYKKGAMLHIDTQKPDRLYIRYGEDRWYIDMLESGRYVLFHNNYSIADNKQRIMKEGFHKQGHNNRIRALFDCIEHYDWRVHLKEDIAEETIPAVAAEDTMSEEVAEKIMEATVEEVTEKASEKKTFWKSAVSWIRKIFAGLAEKNT